MATHSSVLAWRIPGMGEPGGLSSLGSHRVGHDWSNLAAAAAAAAAAVCICSSPACFLGLILEVSFCFVFLFQSQRQYSKCYFGKKGRQKYSLSISPNYHASQFCVFFFSIYIWSFKSMSPLTSTPTGRSMLGPVTSFGLMGCEVYFPIPIFFSGMWFTLLLFWLCHVRS